MRFLTVISIILISTLWSCYKEKIRYGIKTWYVEGKNIDALNKQALPELNRLYMEYNGNATGFEVISKKSATFIVNYVPQFTLLTVWVKPGDSWAVQFKNVDDTMLQMLARDSITTEQLRTMGKTGTKYDTLLVRSDHLYPVQTNGYFIY